MGAIDDSALLPPAAPPLSVDEGLVMGFVLWIPAFFEPDTDPPMRRLAFLHGNITK